MAKAKKKQQKEINIIEEIFPKSKMKELESLVAEMVKAAADVVEEYKDDEEIGEASVCTMLRDWEKGTEFKKLIQNANTKTISR